MQTRFGYHVILLEQTRDRPFAESEQQLRAELQREWIESYISGVQDSAVISWNEAETEAATTE